MQQLLWSIANDSRSSGETLRQVLPVLQRFIEEETQLRANLRDFGVQHWNKMNEQRNECKKKKPTISAPAAADDEDMECDVCRVSLFFSKVECRTSGDSVASWCLQHALQKIKDRPRHTQNVKVFYDYDEDQLRKCLTQTQDAIRSKSQRKTSQHNCSYGKRINLH